MGKIFYTCAPINAEARAAFEAFKRGEQKSVPAPIKSVEPNELLSIPHLAESLARMLHNDIDSGRFKLGGSL